MNELTTDVIERIDALLHACAWCGNGLGTSPSPDFCSEICQREWHTRRCANDESGGLTARVRGRGGTGRAGEVFVSWPRQQPIPPDWLLGVDEQDQPRVELYEPPEDPADLPASVRPGTRLRVQPSDRDDPFWTPLRSAHLVCWDIPRVRACAALWELLEDLLPTAQRVHAGGVGLCRAAPPWFRPPAFLSCPAAGAAAGRREHAAAGLVGHTRQQAGGPGGAALDAVEKL